MQSPKILITRLSHIGDCVLTLPLLGQLRRAMPDANIVWAVEKPANQLLEGHPDLDELILIPKDWLHCPRTILSLRSRLRSHRFDIAVDPQSILKSSALAWLSGARYRIGLSGRHSREFSQCFNNVRVQSEKSHLVDRSLDLLRGLGVNPSAAEFQLPISGDAQRYVADWFSSTGSDVPFYVLNPGASWQSKLWDNERFGIVAAEIHRQTGRLGVVSWAGAAEQQMAAEICEVSGGAAIAAPRTDLQQLAALLAASDYYLGCDTGPMHIACAVGTPCVGLFGTTRPQDSGPYGRQHLNIQRWYQSGTCRQRRQASNDAMMAITVQDVVGKCLEMDARLNPTVQARAA